MFLSDNLIKLLWSPFSGKNMICIVWFWHSFLFFRHLFEECSRTLLRTRCPERQQSSWLGSGNPTAHRQIRLRLLLPDLTGFVVRLLSRTKPSTPLTLRLLKDISPSGGNSASLKRICEFRNAASFPPSASTYYYKRFLFEKGKKTICQIFAPEYSPLLKTVKENDKIPPIHLNVKR